MSFASSRRILLPLVTGSRSAEIRSDDPNLLYDSRDCSLVFFPLCLVKLVFL
jgi:hypothetical protein